MSGNEFVEVRDGEFIRLDHIVEVNGLSMYHDGPSTHCIYRTVHMQVGGVAEGVAAEKILAYVRDRADKPQRKFYPPCPYCAQQGRKSCHETR